MHCIGEHFLLLLDDDMVVNSRIYTGLGVSYGVVQANVGQKLLKPNILRVFTVSQN